MIREESRTYYLEREKAARALADAAGEVGIRHIHLRMAAEYRARAEQATLPVQPMPHAA